MVWNRYSSLSSSRSFLHVNIPHRHRNTGSLRFPSLDRQAEEKTAVLVMSWMEPEIPPHWTCPIREYNFLSLKSSVHSLPVSLNPVRALSPCQSQERPGSVPPIGGCGLTRQRKRASLFTAGEKHLCTRCTESSGYKNTMVIKMSHNPLPPVPTCCLFCWDQFVPEPTRRMNGSTRALGLFTAAPGALMWGIVN